MKHQNLLLLALAGSLSLVACNSGSSSSSPTPAPTSYSFSSLAYNGSASSCTGNMGTYSCNATGASSVQFAIAYSSTPNSYLVIPSQSALPTGVTISTNGTCSTAPVATYNCSITITSTGTNSGATVDIPLNGSIGTQSFISISYQ